MAKRLRARLAQIKMRILRLICWFASLFGRGFHEFPSRDGPEIRQMGEISLPGLMRLLVFLAYAIDRCSCSFTVSEAADGFRPGRDRHSPSASVRMKTCSQKSLPDTRISSGNLKIVHAHESSSFLANSFEPNRNLPALRQSTTFGHKLSCSQQV